jgi:alkylated DNA repair dioxygenase AlkB
MTRKDPTVRLTLHSGDVMCLYGASRRRFHGVGNVMASTNPIKHPAFADCTRINLTLRRAR